MLLAHDAVLGQPNGTIVVGLGLHQSGFRFFEVRAGGFEVGLRIFQIGGCLQQGSFEQRRINERDHVPFMYAGIEIRIELRDAAGNLRSHLHRDHRVDGAGGFHNIFNGSPFHLRCKVLRLRAPIQTQGGEHSRHNYNTH